MQYEIGLNLRYCLLTPLFLLEKLNYVDDGNHEKPNKKIQLCYGLFL